MDEHSDTRNPDWWTIDEALQRLAEMTKARDEFRNSVGLLAKQLSSAAVEIRALKTLVTDLARQLREANAELRERDP